ncbi:H/ACA ribonucleoprotein complex non-core subunit NAF1 [Cloeon dipterum]|uniref:H/ACA ribonucleoprotein complex non-core subunit NAF1 n=1 Tax=Cloeon dipterum TaxID=197152 RepID=UPI00321F9AC2
MEPSDDQAVAQSSTGTVSKSNNLGALGDLNQYDSDSSLDGAVKETGRTKATGYREVTLPDSSDSSSSSYSQASEEEDDSSTETSSEDEFHCASAPQISKLKVPKTHGEIGLEDLPLIEDLTISVQEKECVEIGRISAIVDTLVVVKSIRGKSPLDLDSVLFLDKGQRTLGRIHDVFGSVNEPLYCVRFNSTDHIKERGIEMDMVVYCAPQTDHTTFVLLDELMKIKGSDASWLGNNEPPSECIDYSDDEAEKKSRRKRNVDGESASGGSRVEPSSYEKRMNAKNLARSRLHRNPVGYYNPVAPQSHHHMSNMIPNLPPPHAFGGQPVWPHGMVERFVQPPYQYGPMYPMVPHIPPMPMRGPPPGPHGAPRAHGPPRPRAPSGAHFYRPRY